MIDYLNELRDACLEAYTGIIQGLKGEDDKNVSRECICFLYFRFMLMPCFNVF